MSNDCVPTAWVPVDPKSFVWERCLIGAGVTLLHLLFGMYLLRFNSEGLIDAGDGGLGVGTEISITLVTLSPITPSAQKPYHPPSSLAAMPKMASDVLFTGANRVSTETVVVSSKLGTKVGKVVSANEMLDTTSLNAPTSAKSVDLGGDPLDNDLLNYHAVLRAAIRRKWATLTDRPFPSECGLQLNLGAGGTVNATSASGCALSNEDRLQLEAAALMAQPMPYAGYETVFASDLQLEL